MSLALFVASAALTALLTGFVLRIAQRRGWAVMPDERGMHVVATPSGGGVAMSMTVLLVMTWLGFPTMMLVAAVMVTVVGFMDDLSPLPIAPRLMCQLLAVTAGLYAIGGLPELSFGGTTFILMPVAQVVVAVACLWFLNLYNFMDGIDGLASAELVFVSLSASLFATSPDSRLAWLALAGAGAGFLVWNRAPARIFMGDAGSGFIGLTVGLLLVRAVGRGEFSLWTAMILLAPFACDATVTLLRRIVAGEQWYRPHVGHAYQHLARRWRGHGPVVIAFALVNVVMILPAALLSESCPDIAPLLAVSVLALLSALALWVGAGKRAVNE